MVLGCLVITPESYKTHERHHEIADRVMESLGYNPIDVLEIRISETMTEVDWIHRRSDNSVEHNDDGPIVRTTRIGPR